MKEENLLFSGYGDVHRHAAPPPGPAWERLLGRRQLTVALISLYVIENTGLRLLAALLRGMGVKVWEFYFKDWTTNRFEPPTQKELETFMRELRRVRPDLVGFSVRASAFHCLARDFTELVRRELAAPIVWGGMHATSCPELAAEAADIVCIGEAEKSLPQIVERLQAGLPPSNIPGVWFHAASGLEKGPAPELISDLDALPYPDYSSPDKVFILGGAAQCGDPYIHEPIYLVMASRGCPFSPCAFCSQSVVERIYPGQKRWHIRSVGHVLGELATAKKVFQRLKRVRFDDEEFPFQPEWLREFCERWPAEIGLPFEIHMDPRIVSSERIAMLKRAGLDMVFMGIQNTERINRELYGRNATDRQALEAASVLHASRVRAGYQVIIDDPVSMPQDKRELFELLLRLPRPYDLVLFSLVVYPGSAIEEKLKAMGLLQPRDVEGPAAKVFRQFRVDFGWPRSADDSFHAALLSLVSKTWLPKGLLRRLGDSRWLRRHPAPLRAAAEAANIMKLGGMGLQLLFRGELTWPMVRRWLNFRSVVSC